MGNPPPDEPAEDEQLKDEISLRAFVLPHPGHLGSAVLLIMSWLNTCPHISHLYS
jgi:hypothetical protein